jgi:hypothetical protein
LIELTFLAAPRGTAAFITLRHGRNSGRVVPPAGNDGREAGALLLRARVALFQ